MKKTIHINLNGNAFLIEEDAYEKLQEYLNKIERSIGNPAEAKEIVSDIEARIAELFRGNSKSPEEAITSEHVDEVIKTIGEPQEIIDEEEEKEEKARSQKSTFAHSGYKKRLFRDTSNKVVAGVCSGLGAYFQLDPVIIRVLFIVAFFLDPLVLRPLFIFSIHLSGISLITYIVLWIAMPKAITLKQRLEMKGPAGYEKWENSIKQNPSDSFINEKKYKSQSYSRSGDHVSEFLRSFGKGIGSIIGVFIMLVTFSVLVAVVIAFTFTSTFFEFTNGGDTIASIPYRFFATGDITLGTIGALLVVCIPVLLIFYVGFRLVFKFKTNGAFLAITALCLWLTGWGLVIYTSAKVAKEFTISESVITAKELTPVSGENIYIKPNKSAQLKGDREHLFTFNRLDIYLMDNGLSVQGLPKISVDEGEEFSIVIDKSARGKGRVQAKQNCHNIEYFWMQNDSVIYVDEIFTLSQAALIRDQRVDVTIKVPENKHVIVDDELTWLVDNNVE